MSAELLREAAALMRERAEAAKATGSWDWRSVDGATYWAEMTRGGRYIQSWHPAVALAVADWLEQMATTWNLYENHAIRNTAIVTARTYLGGAS